MQKGDVGMAKCFSKKYGKSYQLRAIRKLCQYACQLANTAVTSFLISMTATTLYSASLEHLNYRKTSL